MAVIIKNFPTNQIMPCNRENRHISYIWDFQDQGHPFQDQRPPFQDPGPPFLDPGLPFQNQGPPIQEQGPPFRDQEPLFQDQGPPFHLLIRMPPRQYAPVLYTLNRTIQQQFYVIKIIFQIIFWFKNNVILWLLSVKVFTSGVLQMTNCLKT